MIPANKNIKKKMRIKELLKNRGLDFSDEDVEKLVKQISAEIKE